MQAPKIPLFAPNIDEMSHEHRLRMIASINHDMRQPFQHMAFCLRGIADEFKVLQQFKQELQYEIQVLCQQYHVDYIPSPEPQTEHADMLDGMKQGLKSAFNLFEDFVEFASDSIQKKDPDSVERKTLVTSNLISAAVDAHCAFAKLYGVDVRAARSPECSIVSRSRNIHRILSNLVDNAIRHSNATKVVVGGHLRTAKEMGEYEFVVSDNGKGIPKEVIDRVAEVPRSPMTHAAPTKRSSTGMGLYVAASLAKQIQARISVQTQDTGTTFRLTVPGPVYRMKERCSAPVARSDSLEGRTIGVLEDREDILRLAKLEFERHGAKVIAASDIDRFINDVALATRAPDLLLLDYMIGDQLSDRVITATRERWGPRLKIIMLSGNLDHPDLRKLAKSIPVLAKPLNDTTLQTIIDVANNVVLYRPQGPLWAI
jgi:CheY-like chemotaxis protein/anti-sigma regulatory factor (Ser/Thr protein kinase)